MAGRTLAPEVRSVLERSTLDGRVIKLPQQLDRPLYVQVDKALKALGGKWNRKAGGHVFSFDVDELLATAQSEGTVVDRKKDLQFFETPEALAARMVTLAGIRPGDVVLEPSAGHGRIVAELPEVRIVAVEIDSVNAEVLRGKVGVNVTVIEADFLEWSKKTEATFDAVVMNPPFTRGQDAQHIRAAFDLLVTGGRLVAICSPGLFFRRDRVATEFRAWFESKGGFCDEMPNGTFVESGTSVRSCLLTVVRGGK